MASRYDDNKNRKGAIGECMCVYVRVVSLNACRCYCCIVLSSICKPIIALSVIERVSSENNQKLGSSSFCAETHVIFSQWIKIMSGRHSGRRGPENRVTEIHYAVSLREFGLIEI